MKISDIIAHNHWFTLNLWGHEIRLCARCSGYVTGILLTFLVKLLNIVSFFYLPLNTLHTLIFLLSLPALIDWGSQFLNLRKSNNKLRYLTGTLLGSAFYLFYII